MRGKNWRRSHLLTRLGFCASADASKQTSEDRSLFDEMDPAARDICCGAAWLLDCQLQFRELQRARFPHMSEPEWLDLFYLWLEHHQAKVDLRVAQLLAEARELHQGAQNYAPERAARLKVIAAEMVDTVAPRLLP
jgi:hypothetical protein